MKLQNKNSDYNVQEGINLSLEYDKLKDKYYLTIDHFGDKKLETFFGKEALEEFLWYSYHMEPEEIKNFIKSKKRIGLDRIQKDKKETRLSKALDKINEENIKVTLKDVLDAKERFEKQVKETTNLIERVKAYGSKELQKRAYDNVTAQLKAMNSFLEGLYNESIGE